MPDHDAVIRTMSRMLKARAWDDPPGLYLLHAEGSRAWVPHSTVVPEAYWSIAPPAEVLGRMTEAFKGISVRPGTSGLLAHAMITVQSFAGFVFCCDIWVRRVPADPDERAAVEAAARARQLAAQAEAVEARQAWAILRDGTRLAVIQERGKPAPVQVEQIKGDIPDALSAMLGMMVTAGAN